MHDKPLSLLNQIGLPPLNSIPIDEVPEEDIINIDLDKLDSDSRADARKMIDAITDLFYDDDFKKTHPQAHKAIEMELETLRILIKMRKADEEAHDAILKAIAENKSNASLYRSMSDIQKTSIAITGKIHDTLDRLNKLCTELTSHIDLDDTGDGDPTDSPEDTANIHRGTKEFIKDMESVAGPVQTELF